MTANSPLCLRLLRRGSRLMLLCTLGALAACCSNNNSTIATQGGPTITTQPQSITVADGQSASFSVIATGVAPLSYQWWRGGTQIGGATGSTYRLAASALADRGAHFSVVVGDATGSVTSAMATLTVTAVAPAISTAPTNQIVPVGTTATFAVVAKGGTAPLSYQWFKGGVSVAGATSATYATSPAAPGDDGSSYTVSVSDSAGSVTSSAALLTVTHTLALRAGKIGGIGNVDGTGAVAEFHYPAGLTMDAGGNIYVADTSSQTIRKIAPGAVVSTFAGMPNVAGYTDATGTSAQFSSPRGVAVDGAGNLYVADTGNNVIRKITPAGAVSTLAGNGTPGFMNGAGAVAQFNAPAGVAVDGAGNVYVADSGNSMIREITPAGIVSTFAGSGIAGSMDAIGIAARFNVPTGVAVDASGNVYVADWLNTTIRKITPAGAVSTLAGAAGNYGEQDGTGALALFSAPTGLALDATGANLYVADYGNNAIRRVTTAAGVVTTMAGSLTALGGSTDAQGTAARFQGPSGDVVDALGNIYVADLANNLIRKIDASVVVSTLAGNVGGHGFVDGSAGVARFSYVSGVASDKAGNLYVADVHNNAIRKVDPNGVVSTLAGNGKPGYVDAAGSGAQFNGPNGVAVDSGGNIYVADGGNFAIRKITPAGVVSTFAGTNTPGSTDGPGVLARFSHPAGVATDANNNVFVADYDNDTIRMITPAGVVTTIAGSAGAIGNNDGVGAGARFWNPHGIATDAAGNVFVAESGNNLIRKVAMPGALVSTLAGNGSPGYADGTGAAAQFNAPAGIAVDAADNVYVADFGNHTMRQVSAGGVVTTVAGSVESAVVTPALSAGPVVLPASLNGPNGVAVLPGSVPGSVVRLAVAEDTENSVLIVTLP